MTTSPRRPVTMADVGAVAGVTSRTVSNVLSGNKPVSPTTRDAVMTAVRQLGYQMNVSARGLRTGRTGLLTLAVPALRIDYFAELALAVVDAAERRGWAVTLQQTQSDRSRELAILGGHDRLLSDGLIFQPHALGPDDRDLLVSDQPVVLLADHPLQAGADQLVLDNVAIGRAGTSHLLGRGRRRIAMIGPNRDSGASLAGAYRLRGYRQALEAAGLASAPELVVEAQRWTWEGGAAAAAELLASGAAFDALFCGNDSLALGAMHVLLSHGLDVPGDVAVVGVDDIKDAARSHPALSTVALETTATASTAVGLLLAQVERDPSYRGPMTRTVPHRVVERASS
ncbi:LacI family DNA-binding transcriptional regulator [Quadrisphaera oryzae]|uniref:LacI family DNA-binding transcriptional regulator n=1 Tax=Quadrisphaera TaxID=317661 RepID=UPI001647D6D7|nr:LacI family DNA-binding transcriptional regulator [Quadrisphaera sp. RL12-1S]MBC3763223.1 LacI family DNA-binding transcriptional regulator [Quadrisphaera sp. RL12-1S]